MSTKDSQFSQYHAMVSALAMQGLSPVDVQPDGSVAKTGIFPLARLARVAQLLLKDDPTHHEHLARMMEELSLTLHAVDPAGHSRDIYFPFAVHLCLATFHRRYENVPPATWSRCEEAIAKMVAPLRDVEIYADRVPPPALVALVLWELLALAEQASLMSRDIDLEFVDSAVAAIVASGGEGEPLHAMAPDDSLDVWTYRELAGLHALARLALHRRNAAWAKRVKQIAKYHLENTQPDNATNQPWALFAFLWSGQTRSFADQQLHDATAHGGGVIPLVSALLLADAADCLAEFL